MRAPFCSESTDLCPEDRDIIGSESENENEIHAIERTLERSRINKTAVFGICLDDLMGTSPQVVPQVPFILSRLCSYIETHGMHQKSLFSEGDEKAVVENLRIEFTESGDAPLENSGHVASVARLLIIFFEELPEPLIPVSAQSDFIRDMENLSLNSSDCLSNLKSSLHKLPDSTYQVLKYISRFLLRVTFHKEYNGMSSNCLALIFAPLIFRPSSNDQQMSITFKNITNCFVKDYHIIFESNEKLNMHSNAKSHTLSTKLSRQPCPSSVMPVMSLSPLSVVIPAVEDANDVETKIANVPILLIEGQMNTSKSSNTCSVKNNKCSKDGIGSLVTRKRKERRFSGEELQQRSSSEERPSPNSFITVETIDVMRRCSSHEDVELDREKTDLVSKIMGTDDSKLIDSYIAKDLELAVNETSLSPQPPTAKRREIEVGRELNLELPWRSYNLVDSSLTNQNDLCNTKQNSVAESPKINTMDCDALDDDDDDASDDEQEFQYSGMSNIPRSASFPVPKSDTSNSNEADRSSLSLSWSMLFEDTEPVRAEPHLNLSKGQNEEETLLSPSVHNLRKSNYYEAPLSPSAYRSYLSYRSTHLDPSVPPSPPVEQEDFAKKLDNSSVSDSIKHLTKKIHSIKKRIRKYDEKFEAEFGFKPSHAEKSNNYEAKKMMSDLYKARKELKTLKEEAHLEQVGSASSWHAARYSHILGDTTNQFLHEINKDKPKASVEDSFGVMMRSLSDDRKTANRPEAFDDMTNDQVKDEKLAIQKVLLNLEKQHGKPVTKEQRNTCRPLYERYRSVKRLLVRFGSFPGATSKNKELCSELQPILEHEAMDFSSYPQKASPVKQEVKETESMEVNLEEESSEKIVEKEEQKGSSSNFLAMKYDNSNLHELPLSEMIFQMQKVRSEKRHLRKILREFEQEFLRLNGRKVQKEDRAPIDSLYNEYKYVKARLRLLEALISKHDQHQLM